MDLNTGWEKEEDPRKVSTFPTSPSKQKEAQQKEIKFTKADIPLDQLQPDNCYFDTIDKGNNHEVAAQGDPLNETGFSMA